MKFASIHGMSHTPEHNAWKKAKQRCTNPNTNQFSDWGGRGIEFRFESFLQFYSAVGPRPRGMVLDRIDNDGHYEPGNVRWATREESVANRRLPKGPAHDPSTGRFIS